MKKLMLVLVLGACAALAADYAYRFRITGTFADARTWDLKRQSQPSRLAAVTVKYAEPYTGRLYLMARQDGVAYVRAVADVSAGTSVAIAPDALWFKADDAVTLSNSVSASAAAVMDFVGN